MAETLRLIDGNYMRRSDLQGLMHYLGATQCVEIIGFSNIGKSALLRLLSNPDVWTQEMGESGKDFLPIYIDCNRMLEMSGQGFYELVLRCFKESSEALAGLPELEQAYTSLVAPSSSFQIPLSFSQGLTAVLKSTSRRLILLLDEFDEPFSHIDSRVFLNLRALKDRHRDRLAFVTATGRSLAGQRVEEHCAEFCELFSHRSWHLAPLTHPDVERYIRHYIDVHETPFVAADIDFIYEWTSGHPRLLECICRLMAIEIMSAEGSENDTVERWQLHRAMPKLLRQDENLNLECRKIWAGCNDQEQLELLGFFTTDHDSSQTIQNLLLDRHLIKHIDGKHQLFCRLMHEHVQRKVIQERSESANLWVDIDSGVVWVNGEPVETLTNLEYRLILILFQNADKIVDKYQIVTHVWGESYLDEVDDTRVEKLVSRLRQKVEPTPSSPHFLSTVRGRGYRLVLE